MNALERSMSTSILSGSSQKVLVHCLVVSTTASGLRLHSHLNHLENRLDRGAHEFDRYLAALPKCFTNSNRVEGTVRFAPYPRTAFGDLTLVAFDRPRNGAGPLEGGKA